MDSESESISRLRTHPLVFSPRVSERERSPSKGGDESRPGLLMSMGEARERGREISTEGREMVRRVRRLSRFFLRVYGL